LKFGLYSQVMDPTRERVFGDVLDELKTQVVLCEEAGFHCVWVDEHHFNTGFNCSTNPLLVGAMLASHTKRIRIGQTDVVGCWQPLRLAEDVALLDHLSRGRVDVGIGRGIRPFDMRNLNPQLGDIWPNPGANFDPKQQIDSREHFAEVLQILQKAWTEEFFSHEGTYYKFPQSGVSLKSAVPSSDSAMVMDGARATMRLAPTPYQKPYPPLWLLMTSEPSFAEAAQLGLNGLVWIQPPKRLKQRLKIYSDARTVREGRHVKVGEDIGILRLVYVAPSYEEAKRDADQFFTPHYQEACKTRPASYWSDGSESEARNVDLDWEFLRDQLLILAGSPEQVVEQIQQLKDISGTDYIILWTEARGMSHKKIMSSLELFATKVAPLFAD